MKRLNWIIVPFLFIIIVLVTSAMAAYESLVLCGNWDEAWEYAKDIAFFQRAKEEQL